MKPKMFVHAFKALPVTRRIKSNTYRTSGFLKLHTSIQLQQSLKVQTDPLLQRSTFTMLRPERKRGTAWKTNVKSKHAGNKSQ